MKRKLQSGLLEAAKAEISEAIEEFGGLMCCAGHAEDVIQDLIPICTLIVSAPLETDDVGDEPTLEQKQELLHFHAEILRAFSRYLKSKEEGL